MKKAIAITHVCFEDAGTLEDALSARGVALRTLQAGVDDLSQAKDADILVVLGGPCGHAAVACEAPTLEAAVRRFLQ